MYLPKHILIVEDEVLTQSYLKEILEDTGTKKVFCVDNAKEALSVLQTHFCEVILMDINIKGNMDGIQLSKKILEKYQVPIVFISAYNDHETVEEVLELSPYGFISKPFTASEMIASLKVAYKQFVLYAKREEKEKDEDLISIGEGYLYSISHKRLYCDDIRITLNAKQTLLIDLLCKNLNTTISFERLTAHIWQEESVSDSSLRTLVYTLRKYLLSFPLYTHSKVGYYLKA